MVSLKGGSGEHPGSLSLGIPLPRPPKPQDRMELGPGPRKGQAGAAIPALMPATGSLDSQHWTYPRGQCPQSSSGRPQRVGALEVIVSCISMPG